MNEKFEVGDKVAVLDEAIEGEVVAVKNNEISIKTTDDFVMTFFVNELVKLQKISDLNNLFSSKSISDVLKDKKEPVKRSFTKEKKSKKEEFVMEVDLHIEKLVQNFRGMSNFDILNIQMDTVKHKLEFAIKNRLPKMVLIHGVGEGVLKSEIEFFLSRYDNVVFQEANFQKYGFGATEVYIKQNPNR
ncbi:Smr/MutS family protein [Flavobacterium tibetense]|uniref:DNA mismatch repair protein MutS n=1 Tax=Flavobacterium tibetense TaxID=2233533 RepID=A0A365P100_9FLAO|nr:Smr/MutS family protein [Flavobacterium tibetense]RBA28188.1 DNA mismatch repair protein MutS [Flavobacterium tibetense]